MRITKKLFISAILLAITCSALYYFWLSPRYVVPIIMYHRFGNENNSLFVSPENFEKQMGYIKRNGFNVIPLDSLVEEIVKNRHPMRKSVVITIDDGHQDFYQYAYPILKRYGFPATVFVIANCVGKQDEFMSWYEARALSAKGISIGAHGKNEVYLPSIKSKDILWDEIAGTKRFIEERIGASVDYFCYPTGGFTQEIKDMVRQAGYKGACTTNRGFVELNRDIYELKRIKITNSDIRKPFSLWAKLSGYYNFFRERKAGS